MHVNVYTSLGVCSCVYACVHAVHVGAGLYVCEYVSVCVCVCVCVRVRVCVWVCVCVCMHACVCA